MMVSIALYTARGITHKNGTLLYNVGKMARYIEKGGECDHSRDQSTGTLDFLVHSVYLPYNYMISGTIISNN